MFFLEQTHLFGNNYNSLTRPQLLNPSSLTNLQSTRQKEISGTMLTTFLKSLFRLLALLQKETQHLIAAFFLSPLICKMQKSAAENYIDRYIQLSSEEG